MSLERCRGKKKAFARDLHENLDRSFLPAEKKRQSDHAFATYGRNLDRVSGVSHGNHRGYAPGREDDLIQYLPARLQDLAHPERLQIEIGDYLVKYRSRQSRKQSV